MPDLQEPSRVLIGGMQTPDGLKAIQELVRACTPAPGSCFEGVCRLTHETETDVSISQL